LLIIQTFFEACGEIIDVKIRSKNKQATFAFIVTTMFDYRNSKTLRALTKQSIGSMARHTTGLKSRLLNQEG